ncbi:hypothetical protein V501_00811 [Pseudogymnoascus sp. VKM F-4519 (FW-2642)]|nr:hypothetical protein V501_00811 [Pseudogymnoascus sp. VKM F-4519 (FW-2642)]
MFTQACSCTTATCAEPALPDHQPPDYDPSCLEGAQGWALGVTSQAGQPLRQRLPPDLDPLCPWGYAAVLGRQEGPQPNTAGGRP